MHRCLLSGGQGVPERVVLFLGERAVDVVRRALAVARGDVGGVHVDALRGHDGRGRVKKVQELAAHLAVDRVEQRIRGQRAGRYNHLPLRDPGHLSIDHLDVQMGLDLFGHRARKRLAVDRKRSARLDAVCVRTGEDQAVQTTQFLFEQSGGIGQLVRAQRVRADQLSEVVRVVRRAVLYRLHLVQAHLNTALRELPRSLAARKASANYRYRINHWRPPLLQPFRQPFSPSPPPFPLHISPAPWRTAPAGS